MFNELVWVNNFYHSSLTRKKLESVFNFVLLWSMFETFACGNNANATSICNKVDVVVRSKHVNLTKYDDIIRHFRKRYLTRARINYRFEDLRFRTRDRQELVRSVLEGEYTDAGNILKALLLIVFRLRNNLFHGLKGVDRLDEQYENFKIANKLLATFIVEFRPHY